MRIVYLHGFASSPRSSKARYFAARFAEVGIPFEVPQLDQGDFGNLTVTNQLAVIARAVSGQPAVLMGSSLGGYLAAFYASQHPEIERLILMAPAFHFAQRWQQRLTPAEIEQWKQSGELPVFHYASGTEQPLGYQFLTDSLGYPPEPDFPQPALILHGRRDDVVPASLSEEFARSHPNVTLELFDSGHELTDVLDPMWTRIWKYLYQNS